ncbi:glutamine--tRNA ligase [Morganella morganii]|uniref:glutamine--tRNA ligase n=1 Tax=Morganella morganii TaxID=582 RepID=UPI001BDAC365|nr:glutamine--tRNA ligase [Morganella morganii]EKU4003496.1 glutamine--tRNA ligase [Morganella morganii]MBT0408187.1 glutamine--tRNA ligase [Morganella morganii subsp. morganii]MBT0426310.1 glutamine--tRNA ligase [Morganella morganii subsp. morganii]MBT0473585.1 glutamine--tRNA ligase [Morganella morganii subsp. morganii]QWL99663.1 glutamine--tRNA ligase [Morganella morganii subsp. morganii]
MNEADARPTNFIRQIIDEDLASGKHTTVHTRFPPEPNGYLHIGHAKSICLNFGIAQDYQGQCNLRFDDTNPVKEDVEYVNSIENDVKWLGFQWSGNVCYSSDYFDTLYNYAVELINKGLAYVCELSPEEIREYRGTLKEPGRNSPYRDRTPEENLALFEKMRDGGFEEGKACLRAKIDMASSFMVMRDPVIYRIKFATHHQSGDKWCIYPMYDFTHCISDALEGITHSLCTLEFQDNRRLYDWVLDNITIDCHPRQYEFSRLNLEYTVMSKRKLNQLVTEKFVEGWDDPRMLTISGLRRRGYTAASIREFCRRIGVTKQDNNVEMAALESCIRDDLNESAPRAMAVIDPVKVVIENMPEGDVMVTMPNHPNKPEMGSREVLFSREIWIDRADFREEANKQYKRLVLNKEVRLRNAFVIKAERAEKDSEGNITTIYCTYDPETLNKDPADGRKVKGVIHWVSVKHAVPAEIRLYDRLFSVPNPGAEDDFLSTLNPDSLVIRQGFVEPSLVSADSSKPYQFEREGYFCADAKLSSADKLVFNRTVGLRDTWAKIESK